MKWKKIESKSHQLGIYKAENFFFLMLWWQAKQKKLKL